MSDRERDTNHRAADKEHPLDEKVNDQIKHADIESANRDAPL